MNPSLADLAKRVNFLWWEAASFQGIPTNNFAEGLNRLAPGNPFAKDLADALEAFVIAKEHGANA